MAPRRIFVVSGGRADVGILRPVLHALADAPELSPALIVTGAHLSPQPASTGEPGKAAMTAPLTELEQTGVPIRHRVDSLLASDSQAAVAAAMGLGTLLFAQVLGADRPDLLLVAGDRSEIFAAVAACAPLNIPVAHLHGGEVTEGAIDDVLRHAISKLSHLHFVSTEGHARRLVRMGERPERVLCTGAPALDALLALPPIDRAQLSAETGLTLDEPPLLVTYHPVTRAPEAQARALDALFGALDDGPWPVVFTQPNADAGHLEIRARIAAAVDRRPHTQALESLGQRRYGALLRHARAMVGNSSSGLVEAASFELPVVNIGERQAGRTRARNVIDVPDERAAIRGAIERACSPRFRAELSGLQNPYGDGQAAPRIAAHLRTVALDGSLLRKGFYDG